MTLDATVAGASADSYLTVAAADALAAADYGPQVDAWTVAVTATKERVLKAATRDVDQHADAGWTRYISTQPLAFPRPADARGTPRLPFVPKPVQLATYYQAIYLLANAAVLAAADTRHARNLASFSEPNVTGTQADAEGPSYGLAPRAREALDALPETAGGGGVASRGLHSIRVSGPPIGWWPS